VPLLVGKKVKVAQGEACREGMRAMGLAGVLQFDWRLAIGVFAVIKGQSNTSTIKNRSTMTPVFLQAVT
jgi:hypothetical protein